MIVNPVKVNGIDNNLKLDADAIKDAILRIDPKSLSPNDMYSELDTTNTDKSLDSTKSIANNCLVGVLTFRLYEKIKYNIEKYLLVNKLKQCNGFNKCQIGFKKNVILRMGKNRDNKKIIEGQMLLGIEDSNYEFLIRYIVNDKDFIRIKGS